MGFSLSWIASKGVDRAAMLERLGLADAGEPEPAVPVPPPTKFAAFEQDGWLFVVSSSCGFASRERIAAVSQSGAAVGAYLEEHVMVSGAFAASDGRLLWSAQHDPEFGEEHLDVWGEPPSVLPGIKAKLLAAQEDDPEVDFMFDVPTELAATVCGFNPNSFDSEVDLVELKVVRRDLLKMGDQPLASAMKDPGGRYPVDPPRKRGLLARLFGAR
ncbi:hypothetical protein [Phenylobacterium sp.]|jgi:hypothetical protein|uniref:hypothetical protein n=1 Tax=Phenylobacterium sp. TaxID=1871053 RepID=UPI0037850EFB